MSSTPREFRCAVCLASDQNYIDYTYVTVLSISEHASLDHHYEIVILSSGVLEYKKQMFYRLNSENIKIRFVDMEEYVKQTEMKEFFISRHISMATYFRYFIPEIFSTYDRVLYMDGDVIAYDDISKIFYFDLNGYLLGVVHDADCFCFSNHRRQYITDSLRIDWQEYFCAGILLYNIPECRTFGLQTKCFETQARLVNPPLHDQDVLNAVTFGKNRTLPTRWHFMWWILAHNKSEAFKKSMPERYKDYLASAQDVALIHYGGGLKPWHRPELPYADLWWHTAQKSPFYERFLSDLHLYQIRSELRSCLTKHHSPTKHFGLKLRYTLCSLLSKITSGALRYKLLQKRHELKARLSK